MASLHLFFVKSHTRYNLYLTTQWQIYVQYRLYLLFTMERSLEYQHSTLWARVRKKVPYFEKRHFLPRSEEKKLQKTFILAFKLIVQPLVRTFFSLLCHSGSNSLTNGQKQQGKSLVQQLHDEYYLLVGLDVAQCSKI